MQETWEMWVRSMGQEDPLENEMSTHSSIIACRIPWAEEPGKLQSIESQKSDTNEATSHTHTHTQKREIWEYWKEIPLLFCV